MTVLIMTHSEENSSYDTVRVELEKLGHEVYRYDTDLFPTAVTLAATHGPDGESFQIRRSSTDGQSTETHLVDLSQISAVWNRRYFTARALPEELDFQLREPSVEESRRSLFGSVACLDVFCLDPLKDSHYARHKGLQLRLARELGMDIPRTLITNDADEVRAFAGSVDGGVVCKMMTSFAVHDDQGRENVVFTNPLSDRDLDELTGLDLCPMTFQESIEKQLELRVTIVGHQVFSASIDSQSSARATHDWRRDGAELAESWQPYELPRELEGRLLSLCSRLSLNYGAIDLILTPDGRFVFLEINPVGEFFWLEKNPGFPISKAIAEVLVDPGKRRVQGRNPHL